MATLEQIAVMRDVALHRGADVETHVITKGGIVITTFRDGTMIGILPDGRVISDKFVGR